jgi:SWI/SNF-related matrix-associated actin-dependent regulator 1 of chromatin subfamily A
VDDIWLLTGTPIANRPMDYYNLLKVCNVPVTDNFQHFAYRYCAAKSFNKKLKSGKIKRIWLTDGASNLEELHEKTKNYINGCNGNGCTLETTETEYDSSLNYKQIIKER